MRAPQTQEACAQQGGTRSCFGPGPAVPSAQTASQLRWKSDQLFQLWQTSVQGGWEDADNPERTDGGDLDGIRS